MESGKPVFIIAGATADMRPPLNPQPPPANCLWIDWKTVAFPFMTVTNDRLIFEFFNAAKKDSKIFNFTIEKISTTTNNIITGHSAAPK